MELVLEPEMYSPTINEMGNYVDNVPPTALMKNGLRCPCGSRSSKTFASCSLFSQHCKTKHHQNWLQSLNTNKTNFYAENIQLKDTVHNQQLVISKLEKELHHKNWMIQYLSSQLQTALQSFETVSDHHSITDLIQFD